VCVCLAIEISGDGIASHLSCTLMNANCFVILAIGKCFICYASPLPTDCLLEVEEKGNESSCNEEEEHTRDETKTKDNLSKQFAQQRLRLVVVLFQQIIHQSNPSIRTSACLTSKKIFPSLAIKTWLACLLAR